MLISIELFPFTILRISISHVVKYCHRYGLTLVPCVAGLAAPYRLTLIPLLMWWVIPFAGHSCMFTFPLSSYVMHPAVLYPFVHRYSTLPFHLSGYSHHTRYVFVPVCIITLPGMTRHTLRARSSIATRFSPYPSPPPTPHPSLKLPSLPPKTTLPPSPRQSTSNHFSLAPSPPPTTPSPATPQFALSLSCVTSFYPHLTGQLIQSVIPTSQVHS